MSITGKPRAATRIAGLLRASAGLGFGLGWLLAAVAVAAGARPLGGVPAWGWIALAFACLLVREAWPEPAPGSQRPRGERVRRDRRPR
jgi:hypothetical protein